MRVIHTSKGMSKKFGVRVIYKKYGKWFKVNLLSINVDKTHYIKFKAKKQAHA
jgi:hypothetical protein